MHMYVFSLRKHKIHLLHFKEKIRSEADINTTINFIFSRCYPSANREHLQNSLGDSYIPSLNFNRIDASKFLMTLKIPAEQFAFI